jgi:putative SOS response-associated peptidase YedK
MCGRVRLSSDVSEIKLVFSIPPHRTTPNFPPSWNAAPTDLLPVVRYDRKASERSLDRKKTATGKQPYAVALADRSLMALAGLWENWRSPAGEWVQLRDRHDDAERTMCRVAQSYAGRPRA